MSNPFSLHCRNFLVTGGTRGIGRAISLQLAGAGAKVVAVYVRNEAKALELEAVAKTANQAIIPCRADLSTSKGLRLVEEKLDSLGGPLHGLIHCAATGVHKPFVELEIRHYEWTFALNVRAFLELTKRCVPRLGPGGTILALSSQGATRAIPAYSVIGASKGAIEALARHLAVELGPLGIRVNVLSPGAVATEAWGAFPDAENRLDALAEKTPIGRLARPEDVAYAAHFLLSDGASAITGQVLQIDGGAGLPI